MGLIAIYIALFAIVIGLILTFIFWTIKTYKNKRWTLFIIQFILIISITVLTIYNAVSNKTEIAIFESSLGVKLPSDYKIIKSESIGYLSDLTIILQMKLSKSDNNNLINQIKSKRNYITDTILQKQYIKYPLMRNSTDKLGFWSKKDSEYIYKEPYENRAAVQCTISEIGVIDFLYRFE